MIRHEQKKKGLRSRSTLLLRELESRTRTTRWRLEEPLDECARELLPGSIENYLCKKKELDLPY